MFTLPLIINDAVILRRYTGGKSEKSVNKMLDYPPAMFRSLEAKLQYIEIHQEAILEIAKIANCAAYVPMLNTNFERDDGIVSICFAMNEIVLEVRGYHYNIAVQGGGKICQIQKWWRQDLLEAKIDEIRDVVQRAFRVENKEYERLILEGPAPIHQKHRAEFEGHRQSTNTPGTTP